MHIEECTMTHQRRANPAASARHAIAAQIQACSWAGSALRKDVGRHDAVDRLMGRALLDGALPLAGQALMVSGRLSFEIVLKALAGFVRGERLNVYTWPARVRPREA